MYNVALGLMVPFMPSLCLAGPYLSHRRKAFRGTGGPTLIASDNFDSYSNDYSLADAANWNVQTGFIYVSNGSGTAGKYYSNSDPGIVYHTASFSANHRSEATIANIGSSFQFMGLAVRCQSGSDSCYYVQVDGSIYFLVRRNSGSNTVLTSAASLSLAANDKIALEASGTGSATRLKFQKYTGGVWSDVEASTDPGGTYIDGGAPGVQCASGAAGTAAGDNWNGYDL